MSETQSQTAADWLDDFVDYIKQAIAIVQLDEDAIDRARADHDAFTMGLVIIALAGVANAIGDSSVFGVVSWPVVYLVSAFLGAGVLHLIATVAFGGEGEFISFFRPFSLAFILAWVNVVWVLNTVLVPVAAVWLCVVAVISVEREYGLQRPQAMMTVAVPVAILLFLTLLFFAFLGVAAVFFGMART